MAKILFVTLPYPGCLHPHLAVAVALARRGHEVAFFTGAAMRHRVVEEAGLAFFPFPAPLDAHYAGLITSPTESIGANWSRRGWLRGRLRAFFADAMPMQYDGLVETLAQWPADLIVSDPAIWTPYMILAETHRIPVVIVSYVLGNNLAGPGIPPMGMGLRPPRHFLEQLYNRAAAQVMAWYMGEVRRPANAFRRGFGLPSVRGPVIQLGEKLPLFIVPASSELDFCRQDRPGNAHYVGPLTWYPPRPPTPWLDDLPHDHPWVHATEGTIHFHDPVVLKTTAAALANQPATAIITTGGNREPDEAGLVGLADNVKVARWINHSELLPRIDLLVCTAGSGVMLAALYEGVPIIAVPTEWDHVDNAQRLAYTGAGILLPRKQCHPERLRQEIFRVLQTSAYRENAARVGAGLRELGGAERAADLIEGIL